MQESVIMIIMLGIAPHHLDHKQQDVISIEVQKTQHETLKPHKFQGMEVLTGKK